MNVLISFECVCAQVGTELDEEYLWALSLKACHAWDTARTGQKRQSALRKNQQVLKETCNILINDY